MNTPKSMLWSLRWETLPGEAELLIRRPSSIQPTVCFVSSSIIHPWEMERSQIQSCLKGQSLVREVPTGDKLRYDVIDLRTAANVLPSPCSRFHFPYVCLSAVDCGLKIANGRF